MSESVEQTEGAPMPSAGDRWIRRRRAMTAVMLFCAAVIIYCLFKNSENVLFQTALNSSFLLLGSTLVTFVGGAVMDDRFQKPGG